jgi:hypothetical protein
MNIREMENFNSHYIYRAYSYNHQCYDKTKTPEKDVAQSAASFSGVLRSKSKRGAQSAPLLLYVTTRLQV